MEACPSTKLEEEMRKESSGNNPLDEVVDGGDRDHYNGAEEEEKEEEGETVGFALGPLISLKDHLEKDKDDDSLRRWKEKLLGCTESDLDDQIEPEVKFHSIGIVSDEFVDQTVSLPIEGNHSDGVFFTLKEGSRYRRKLTFSILHNIVSGLTYSNTVWKGGMQVDQSNEMMGTFAPRQEPYVHILEEETIPSGVLARGTYLAKLKFEDDDRRCHMELNYSFEIKKSN